MARLPKRGLSEARRAFRWQTPAGFEITAALIIGLLAMALTVLRSLGGMDPDRAAAHGVALALGVFAGCLVIPVFMKINVYTTHEYMRRVFEPWGERIRRRQEAIASRFERLEEYGFVADAGGPPERMDSERRDRFHSAVEWGTYGAWVVFALLFSQVVSRVLLAASGLEGVAVHPVLVASLAASVASSLLIFQMPLAVTTGILLRVERTMGNLEKALDRLERGESAETSRAMPALQWPALVEPVVRRLGPISVPGWRQPQPDAR